MKRLVIIFGSFFVLGVGFILFNRYQNSFQDVSITIKTPNLTLALYKATENDDVLQKTGDPIRTITTDSTFSVRKGSYQLVPQGEHVITTPIDLAVSDKPVHQTIDLPYNDQYLRELLAEETPAILEAINTAYPQIATDYTVNEGKLFGRGEWFGTTLSNNIGPLEDVYGDTLRILLHKDNSTWTVISKPPSIFLTVPDYKNVPLSILRGVDDL